MTKELAREILKVFDTPSTVDTIIAYADHEIDKANKIMSTTGDTTEIFRLQGVIRSMTVLKKIRTEAENQLKG